MMNDPILYETHMHTPLCKHARGEPEDYAKVAESRGFRGITVTCHNPMPNGFSAGVRMAMDEFPQYLDLVERARQEWLGRIDVRLGMECDYFPGYEQFLAKQSQSADFDYLIGSVHPQTGEYKAAYLGDDLLAYYRTYYGHLADMAELGLYDSISHPDIIKNVKPSAWDVDAIMPDICRALDRIAATGISMELNTSGLLKRIPEMNPGPEILEQMNQRDIPMVIGADAHDPSRAGDQYDLAMDLLEAAGYTSFGFFLERERQEVSIEEARASLALV